MEKLRIFYLKYKHAIPLIIYGIIYMAWFAWLEKNTTGHYRIIHMAADDYIPFCEVFVIPYFLWFAYVSAVVIYFFFKNKEDYYRTCIFLFTGMTIFLIVSTLWPNGQHLRPAVMPRDNIFTRMVAALYRTDTPTNLWPSIHVYNSVAAFSAIHTCKNLQKHKGIRTGSFILTTLIILSTMFLKQHSIADVATGITCAVATYVLFYSRAAEKQGAKSKQRSPLHQHDTHM